MSNMEYRSVFAPYILALIRQKRSAGYIYTNGAVMLHLFDLFCAESGFKEQRLTEELLDSWSELRPGERIRYRSQRVTYVRQLAKYMASIGIDTCVPLKLRPEPMQGRRILPFSSTLAPYIRGLVAQKRANGYKYDDAALVLYRFDQFCVKGGFSGDGLPRELVMEWLMRRDGEGNRSHSGRITYIRQLSYYMLSLGKDAYTPKALHSAPASAPHIFTLEELSTFFFEVDHFVPDYRSKSRMAMAYSILFRLYYCCGLRLSEGVKLRISDVDLETGRITIYQSKGQKDRSVFVADDLLEMCKHYNESVEKELPHREWFFPSSDGEKPFYKTNMDRRFKYFWSKTPYAGKVDREPTIHALRHTFVVHRINDWMRNGGDFQVLLPYLSRYLGHKSFDETYYYYHLSISSFDIIKSFDTDSSLVIPEVQHYEE